VEDTVLAPAVTDAGTGPEEVGGPTLPLTDAFMFETTTEEIADGLEL
jgi:hypothetical protein